MKMVFIGGGGKMVHRTNDIGNLVKQGFDQLAAANALEITGNNFVRKLLQFFKLKKQLIYLFY
jgi:hypothetical protein